MTPERSRVAEQHEDERARLSREKRAKTAGEVEAEERWQRRIWATMPVASVESSGDFWGSKL